MVTVYQELETSAEGLTSADAKTRLEKYGRNELVDKEVSDLQKFLRFFWGPIAWMIEAAALLSLLMGHWPDLAIIFGNAIKFTERGEIAVSVAQVDRTDQNATLQFSVRDTGIGIPLEKIEAIFRPFEQADTSTTRQFGGPGLGLAISVQLIELMGGRIWAESEPGQGSTFHFTAQLGLGKATPTPGILQLQELFDGLPVLVVDDNATNRRILLAEDNEVNQKFAVRAIEKAGHAVVVANNGLEAVATWERERFDVILMDVRMPELDGR